jgi:hypothetical protein
MKPAGEKSQWLRLDDAPEGASEVPKAFRRGVYRPLHPRLATVNTRVHRPVRGTCKALNSRAFLTLCFGLKIALTGD